MPLNYKIAIGLFSSTCALLNNQRGFNRFSSTLLTTASICIDYRIQDVIDNKDLMECHDRSARKLSNLCFTNGGLFIKAAQHLSSMDHLLPAAYIKEFSRLQDSAGFSSLNFVEKVFEEEFGVKLDEVFSDICEIPIGSASIGQVHRAKLKETGEEVALKIQHPNVKSDSEIDLWAFSYALKMIKFIFPTFNFDWLIDEVKDCLKNELNFKMEAENSKITKSIFENDPKFRKIVQIPKVYDIYTSERVLTMQFLPGFKINESERLKYEGIDLNRVNSEIYKIFMEMIYKHQFVHCDPHPGNILINQDKKTGDIKIILLDHGIYKNVPSEVIKTFSKLFLAILGQDEKEIKEISKELKISSNVLNQFTTLLQAFRNNGGNNTPSSTVIKEFISNQSDNSKRQASNAIQSLPRELLFLIKILDLLRSNERMLTRNNNSNNGTPLIPESLMIITSYSMSALDPNSNDNNSIKNVFNVYMKLFYSYIKIQQIRNQRIESNHNK